MEVKVKAHAVKVPVNGRVLDPEEYDRLDAESLSLHGRRIGRVGPEMPVTQVLDEKYCVKLLGDKYMPPPAHITWQMSQDTGVSDGVPTMPTLGQAMPFVRRGQGESMITSSP